MGVGELGGVGEKTVGGGKQSAGWHVLWPKLFSKEYLFTKITLLSIIPWLLFLPVEPWMPQESELQEVVGKPIFRQAKALTLEVSGLTFSINDIKLHCIFSSKGGVNGCKLFQDRVDPNAPATATYFIMKTHYGMSTKILNSLKQNGRDIMTPDKLYQIRVTHFQEDKKFSIFMAGMFVLLILLAWRTDRKNLWGTGVIKETAKHNKEEHQHAADDNLKKTSGFRSVRKTLFSKDYEYTRMMLIVTAGFFFLAKPVEPWIPEKNELHELYGKAEFKYFNTKSMSGIYLKVDGILLSCTMTGSGALYGCGRFEDLVNTRNNVQATYFWSTTAHGISYRMLNSIEQDGRMIVTAEDTYKRRLLGFSADKKHSTFMTILFLIIAFILWLGERRNIKEKQTNSLGDSV